MPNRGSKVAAPREYTAVYRIPGDETTKEYRWPDGPFDAATPPAVFYAVEIAKRLRAALDGSGESVTAIAAALSVSRSTLYDIISGITWADSFTLAEAESYFGVRLWPEHVPAAR